MGEFKYINEFATDMQKLLNQWKHEYKIEVFTSKIYFTPGDVNAKIAMLIWRQKI